MKAFEKLKHRTERLLTAPGEELGRWARFIRFQIQLWRFCARRLRQSNAMAMSSALSFRTVFAMVPLLVLVGLAMKTGGVLEKTKRDVRQYVIAKGFAHIAQYGTGATTQPAAPAAPATPTQPAPGTTSQPVRVVNVADRIEKIITQAEEKLTFGTIGPVGVVLLIWSALTLLTTMERSLNRIFDAPRSRSLGRRVLLYWSVVTLGPVLLAAAIFLGGRSAAAFADMPGVSWLLAAVGWSGPVLVGIFLLAGLYKLMPNTKVSFGSAFGGAVVAVPVWLLAKWAFGLYVGSLVGKPTIYGALGLVPLFLLWLNFSWLIFLFGAQLAHTAVNLGRMRSAELAERIMLGPWEMLAATVAVAQPYRKGLGPIGFEEIVQQLNLPDASVRQLMDRLVTAGVVCPVESGRGGAYVLGKPAEKISVLQFLGAGALPGESPPERYEPTIAQALAQLQGRTRDALGSLTLAELIGN